MRIAILSQYYPPELGAPQNRLSDLARRLTDRGHTVEVLTALPNYPGAKVFPAYRTHSMVHEVLDGVPVHRLGLYVPSKRTSLREAAHYGSFAVNAFLRGPRVLSNADIVLTESPPLFLAPVGAYLARRLGAKFVLNVSELWPATPLGLGTLSPGLVAKTAVRWEERAYRQADLIMGQSNGVVEDISARFPDKHVHLFPNGVDLALWRNIPSRRAARRALGWSEQTFMVGYVGLHGPAQGLEQVIHAAQRLRDEVRIQIALFGDGPDKARLQQLAKQFDLANVLFYAPEPHSRVPSIMTALDLGLVPLADREVLTGIRPAKMLEFMAASRPILLAARGEPIRILQDSGAGIAVAPEDPQRLALAIRDMAAEPERRELMGQRGRRYVEAEGDREKITAHIEDLLHRHLGR